MTAYKSKPKLVDAEQYHDGQPDVVGICRCVAPNDQSGAMRKMQDPGHTPHVHTAHNQPVNVVDGDWIVAEPDGRGYYPVKDDVFRRSYEPNE